MALIKLPGLIDIHVHLRDPGQTHKEDFYTGTSAALAGGITTVFDMPNNLEPIFTYGKLMEKMEIAKQKAVCDYGFYFGTNGKNLEEFEKVKDLVVGLKLYLSLTTGKYIVDDGKLVEEIFATWPKEKIIVIHVEGEKVDLAIQFGKKYNSKFHITHVSNRQMLEKIIRAKEEGINITCDVTPHHLFLSNEQISDRNTEGINKKGFYTVKPPIASREDIDFLWDHLSEIDCIATDHAPHTISEKQSDNPPSGMPGLETMLPLLLTAVKTNKLSLEDVRRLTNTNPQKIFGFKQDENTYVEVDLDEKYKIENKKLKTKCGWSLFDGWEVVGRVKRVFIRGTKVFEDEKILAEPGFGKPVV